ncbi:MAG: hypothetical protein ACRDT6_25915 [Micromonosporaceae bacterium]
MGKKQDAAVEQALREGWESACQLYEHLAAGGELAVLPPSAVRLNQNEVPYADAMIGYARYYGQQVTYQQSSMLLLGSATFVAAGLAANAIGNASARRRAEAQAATQWRDHAQVRAMVSNERILADYNGQWLSFWHNGVVELQGDLSQWVFVLRYEVGDPLMVHGPAAPWFATVIARLVYGQRGLQLPALAPLAQSVQAARAQRPAIGPGGNVISGEIVTDSDGGANPGGQHPPGTSIG